MNAVTKYTKRFFGEITILLVSAISIIPIIFAVLGAFKNSREASLMRFTLPSEWVTDNIIKVVSNPAYQRSFINSLFYVAATLTVTILITSMAAYVIARRKMKLNNFIYYLLICGMIVPWFVIPSIRLLQSLNLLATYQGVTLMYITANIPFSVFLMTGFIKGVPKDFDEAACVDGCSPIRTFFQIIFPLLKPVTVTLLIWCGVSVWNDMQIGLFFGGRMTFYPINVWTYMSIGERVTAWENLFAATVITMLPAMILYLFAQKYIVSGMTAGAIKS